MRVLYNNLGDLAQYFPNNEAIGYPISNVYRDVKGLTFRSNTTLNILATWQTVKSLNCLILPFCSLSNSSTIRVRLYSDELGSVLLYDTGVLNVRTVDSHTLGTVEYTYSTGGGFTRAVYFPKITGVIRASIDIVENSLNYIELSRILLGEYWEPKIGVEYGYSIKYNEEVSSLRTLANTLVSSDSTSSKVLDFVLPYLSGSDMGQLANILRLNQIHVPLFVSLFPNDTDPNTEHTYQIYGKLSYMPSIVYPSNGHFTSNIEIEEI